MLNVAICEDCPLQTEVIQMLLARYQSERPDIELCIHSFYSGHDLLSRMNDGYSFDLFLLDILMPEQSGIEIAHELRKIDTDVPLIFLTSSADYTLDAFGVWAVQYILKPITEKKLFPAFDKIIPMIKPAKERIFALSTRNRIVYIPFSSITHVELAGRAFQVTQNNGQTFMSSSIRMPFAKAVEPLLEDSRFVSPHISFVINMAYVKELGRASFILKNGVQVPIPRYKYASIKEKYLTYLTHLETGANHYLFGKG